MRAIIESKKTTSDIPDIDVLVAQGTNDVSIKISDQVKKYLGELCSEKV